MVGLVGTRVIVERIDTSVTDRANRAPIEISEVDDKVRRDSLELPVELFRPVDLSSRYCFPPVRDRLDFSISSFLSFS